MKLKHKFALFIVYFILFLAITAMIDYYAYDEIPPWIFIIISFVAAVISAQIHAKSKQKTKADELAKELEEII